MKIICVHDDAIYVKPDTALLRENRPFYIPTPLTEIRYREGIVVRVDRVGKCIEARFAQRYYHEVGAGVELFADELPTWMDHSLAVSPEFVPIGDVPGKSEEIDTLIHRISQYMTLKMGDLIFIATAPFRTAKPGDRIRTSHYKQNLLDFEIR